MLHTFVGNKVLNRYF